MPCKSFLCCGAIIGALLTLAHAQPSPYPSPEVKPKAPTAAPLPPLPRVKGTIAKPPETPDGKVTGLNAEVFVAYEAIIHVNPSALTTKEALALRDAIIKDDQIDAVEADLLADLTYTAFRSITITKAGVAEKPPTLKVYPCSGQARTVLRETLFPTLNLEESWAAGVSGWTAIVLESKKNASEEQRVATFLQSRIADAWEASNQGNGYKPLRDLLAQRYGYTKVASFPADQAANARTLMINACQAVDRKAGDQIPDYLYTWWK